MVEYETLSKIIDDAVKDISLKLASIEMYRIQDVNVSFTRPIYLAVTIKGNKEMQIVLQAEETLLKKISGCMKRQPVDNDDVTLYAAEFFNILCGHIIASCNKVNHTRTRFSVPTLLKHDDKDSYLTNTKVHQFNYKSNNEILSIQIIFQGINTDKGANKMKKRLLVVDDSIFIYEEIRSLLKDSDYEVVQWVKTGEDALDVYEELKPDFVTMDIIMSGADGIDITREIVNKWKDAKVIVVTSLASDEIKEEAKAAGACDILYKPFNKEGLLDILNKNCD